MSYSLLEAWRELQEEVDENLFANYVSDLWIFTDVLKNKRILTNFNQQSGRDFDFRGNHVCLTNDLINPPAIMPQLNFGIVIDKAELVKYINDNPDKFRKVPPFALKNLRDSASVDKDKLLSLDIHDDSRYRRWVQKNLAQGMFIQGLSYYSGSYYIKFKQWTWREIPKDNDNIYSDKIVDFCKKIHNIFSRQYEEQKSKESTNNKDPETILNLILRDKEVEEKEAENDVEPDDENNKVNEQLKLTEAPISIDANDVESREKAIKLISCICILLREFYTVNFSDFIDHFSINLKGAKRKNKNKIGNTLSSNHLNEVQFIEQNFEDIVSGAENNKYTAFAQIAYYFKCGNVGGGRAGRLFKLTPEDIKTKSNDYYYFKKDNILDLQNDDFIFVVSPDGTSGVNSYLQIRASDVNENCCIALETDLVDDLEVTDYEIKDYDINDSLSDEETNIIDKLILNEHEYRLYVPEVDKAKQTKNDYENIDNAYFTFNSNDIVKELKLPKVYQQYNTNNPLQTAPVYGFNLYEWLNSNDSDKLSTYTLKQYVVADTTKKKDQLDKINSVIPSLRNDLIDFYKQLQLYKNNGVKLNFYEVKTGNFKSLSTMYVDGEKKDYSNVIDDKELNAEKQYSLDSISSQSYKTIDSYITTNSANSNSRLVGKRFKQTFTDGNKPARTEWFSEVQTGSKKTSDNQNIARLQGAALVYYCDDEHETCNIKDKDKHIYVLMYNESGHLDIPHTGIQSGSTPAKAAADAVHDDTNLQLTFSEADNSKNAYLYYENASKFWNKVKEKDSLLKWYYYYNFLLYKKVDENEFNKPIKSGSQWVNVYDLFTGHIGKFCHIKATIYQLLLKLKEIGSASTAVNKRLKEIPIKRIKDAKGKLVYGWQTVTYNDDGSKTIWKYYDPDKNKVKQALELAYDSDWNNDLWKKLLGKKNLLHVSTKDNIVVNIRQYKTKTGKIRYMFSREIPNPTKDQMNGTIHRNGKISTSWSYHNDSRDNVEKALKLANDINWSSYAQWQKELKDKNLKDEKDKNLKNEKEN